MEANIVIRDTDVKVTDILEKIAAGNSYAQILESYPALTTADIMTTARLCLDLIKGHISTEGIIKMEGTIRITARSGKVVNLTEVRKTFPRAYEPWKPKEEQTLRELFDQGTPFTEIAEVLQRNVGAVISRLKKLELLK